MLKRRIAATVFPGVRPQGERRPNCWGGFLACVRDPDVIEQKDRQWGFSFATFARDYRNLTNVERVHALVLDLDQNCSVEQAATLFPNRAAVYSTHSHTAEYAKSRLVLPYSRPVSAAEYKVVWLWARDKCTQAGHVPDPRAKDASHFFFGPGHRAGAPYAHKLVEGPALDVEEAIRAHPTRAVPGSAAPRLAHGRPPEQHEGAHSSKDRSPSGRDFALALSMLREGASDDEIGRALKKRSPKAAARDDYVQRTIERARETHDANAPLARRREARLEHLPERFGRPALTRVHLDLRTDDGQILHASIVVPSPDYARSLPTWQACFPDVDPVPLTSASTRAVEAAWRSIDWRGRRWHVATRDREVVWIRAADFRASLRNNERQKERA